MAASFLGEITIDDIKHRLKQVMAVYVESCGAERVDYEYYNQRANEQLFCVTVNDVYQLLKNQHICMDDKMAEIDCAIGVACEPDDLPECACVELVM